MQLSARLVEAQSKLGLHITPADRAKFESQWRELVSARQIMDRLKMNDASAADLEKLAAVAKVLAKNNIPSTKHCANPRRSSRATSSRASGLPS